MTDRHNGGDQTIGSELLREDASLEEVVLFFAEGLATRVAAMESAARQGDFETLRNTAHQLKGSGGGHGYPVLTQCAGSLEQEAQAQHVDRCLAALEELKDICERIAVKPAA